tara:strand:- start:441 stop:1655 length:1215 start_codon:yes stop_codon:yes gene_type:complete
MITYGKKDMFDLDVDCIVNTVNCRVDKLYERQARDPERFKTAQLGLAAAFEKRFPESQGALIRACKAGQMKPGMVLAVTMDRKTGKRVPAGEGDLVVAHASTKDHWQKPSELEWAKSCAQKLAKLVEDRGLKSIAIPPLGAGMGKLEWKDVQREIHTAMEPLAKKGVNVFVLGDDVLGLGEKQSPAREASVVTKTEDGTKRIPIAGIGWRDAPPEQREKMTQVGEIMAKEGFELRSGGAGGSDAAFEQGFKNAGGAMRIFLPKNYFNGRKADGKTYIHDITPAQYAMGEKYYDRDWKRASGFTKDAMARNGAQVLGDRLDDPVGVVLCHTENGRVKGGTGQALRIANDKGVPVINFGDARWKDVSAVNIADAAMKVARKEATLEDVEKEHAKTKSSYIVIGDER